MAITIPSFQPGQVLTAQQLNAYLKEPVEAHDQWIEDANAVWPVYTSTWTSSAPAPVLGDGEIGGRYKRLGSTVFFRISLVGKTGTGWGGGGQWTFSLPVPPYTGFGSNPATQHIIDGQWQARDVSTGEAYFGMVDLAGSVVNLVIPQGLDNNTVINATTPFTWAANDWLSVAGWYVAAT